jgi:hypothetical protein
MADHPLQTCPLLDRQYQSTARHALAVICQCFSSRINALRLAYDHYAITADQLATARKGLLSEAAFILYSHPADDPHTILQKLTASADLLRQETQSFQVESYIATLST